MRIAGTLNTSQHWKAAFLEQTDDPRRPELPTSLGGDCPISCG